MTIVPSNPTQRVPSGGVSFGSNPVGGSKILTRVTWAMSSPVSSMTSVSPRLPLVGPVAPLGVDPSPPGNAGSEIVFALDVVPPHAATSAVAAPSTPSARTVRHLSVAVVLVLVTDCSSWLGLVAVSRA